MSSLLFIHFIINECENYLYPLSPSRIKSSLELASGLTRSWYGELFIVSFATVLVRSVVGNNTFSSFDIQIEHSIPFQGIPSKMVPSRGSSKPVASVLLQDVWLFPVSDGRTLFLFCRANAKQIFNVPFFFEYLF